MFPRSGSLLICSFPCSVLRPPLASEDDTSQFDTKFTKQTPIDSPDDGEYPSVESVGLPSVREIQNICLTIELSSREHVVGFRERGVRRLHLRGAFGIRRTAQINA